MAKSDLIKPERYNSLKASVKAEMLRRNKNGSVESYGGVNYDYSTQPTSSVTINQEHYTKLIEPLRAVNPSGLPDANAVERVVSEDDIALMEAQLAVFKTKPNDYHEDTGTGDCAGACTGLCVTACSGTCIGTCTNECGVSCGTACNKACSDGCTGSCGTACKKNCGTGCADSCGTTCNEACSNCSSSCGTSCDKGCADDCSTACGRAGTCSAKCAGGCEDGCGGCGGVCQNGTGTCTNCGNVCQAGNCSSGCSYACNNTCYSKVANGEQAALASLITSVVNMTE